MQINRALFLKKNSFYSHWLIGFAKSFLLCISPAFISAAIIMMLKFSSAETVEKIYSRKIFVGISYILSSIAKIADFSIAAVLLASLAFLAVACLFLFLFFLAFKHEKAAVLKRFLCFTALVLSCILLLFTVLCAPNYYRLTFAAQADIPLSSYNSEQLADLCKYLIAQTNEQRIKILKEQRLDNTKLALETLNSFNALNEDYPFLGEAAVSAKPVFFSELLSILNLTGFYFPYTAEANVNANIPYTELPFTMCHELAHTRGFMREDEANFIGYIACLKSSNATVQYSGLYIALINCMNTLAIADPQAFYQLRQTYSAKLEGDIIETGEYWNQYFDTPAADLSSKVNDAYLKANDTSDGIKSYNRMVDLIMSQYLINQSQR